MIEFPTDLESTLARAQLLTADALRRHNGWNAAQLAVAGLEAQDCGAPPEEVASVLNRRDLYIGGVGLSSPSHLTPAVSTLDSSSMNP